MSLDTSYVCMLGYKRFFVIVWHVKCFLHVAFVHFPSYCISCRNLTIVSTDSHYREMGISRVRDGSSIVSASWLAG